MRTHTRVIFSWQAAFYLIIYKDVQPNWKKDSLIQMFKYFPVSYTLRSLTLHTQIIALNLYIFGNASKVNFANSYSMASVFFNSTWFMFWALASIQLIFPSCTAPCQKKTIKLKINLEMFQRDKYALMISCCRS